MTIHSDLRKIEKRMIFGLGMVFGIFISFLLMIMIIILY